MVGSLGSTGSDFCLASSESPMRQSAAKYMPALRGRESFLVMFHSSRARDWDRIGMKSGPRILLFPRKTKQEFNSVQQGFLSVLEKLHQRLLPTIIDAPPVL